MEETLTLTWLGVTRSLKRTLESTKPVRVDARDRPPHPAQREALVVGRDGAALDGRRHARSRTAVRKIVGYRDLATLVIAIERDHDRRRTHADAARTFRPTYYSPERDMSSRAI